MGEHGSGNGRDGCGISVGQSGKQLADLSAQQGCSSQASSRVTVPQARQPGRQPHLGLPAGGLLPGKPLQGLAHAVSLERHLALTGIAVAGSHEVHLYQQLCMLVDKAVQLGVLPGLEGCRPHLCLRRRGPRWQRPRRRASRNRSRRLRWQVLPKRGGQRLLPHHCRALGARRQCRHRRALHRRRRDQHQARRGLNRHRGPRVICVRGSSSCQGSQASKVGWEGCRQTGRQAGGQTGESWEGWEDSRQVAKTANMPHERMPHENSIHNMRANGGRRFS